MAAADGRVHYYWLVRTRFDNWTYETQLSDGSKLTCGGRWHTPREAMQVAEENGYIRHPSERGSDDAN